MTSYSILTSFFICLKLHQIKKLTNILQSDVDLESLLIYRSSVFPPFFIYYDKVFCYQLNICGNKHFCYFTSYPFHNK